MSTTLPAPLTRFIGRESELARAAALLADARLLTLTGPGGAGKTRLAVQLASVVGDQFPDGIWFVDFSPLSDAKFVWDRVGLSIGVKEPGSGRTLAEAVGRRLASSRSLVVLDNCEHLVEPAAEVAASLLTASPALKIVATSREPLAVAGEVTWAVPPLSEPDAVELFSDRARQVRPEFGIREEDADAVRYICRRLDGLPLAIELAAARARALDPAYIADGLRHHLSFLPSGPRTAPQRQSTLAASFDWSHELLSEAERALLRQLSVFAGGFDVEAAVAVCPAASLEQLAALTDRSMMVVERRRDRSDPRYRMLETVREFAAEHLEEAEEVDLMRTRHRDYYLALAETAEPKLWGPEQARWLARLRTEQDNLRAALAWSRDRDEGEALTRLVWALKDFWGIPGRWIEAQTWLEAAADRAGGLSPRHLARLRLMQGYVPLFAGQGSPGEVPALANEALALARSSGGDTYVEALALGLLGTFAGMVGGAQAMRPYVEEALPLARSAGFAAVFTLAAFVLLRMYASEPEETWRLAEEAMAIAKAAGDSHMLLWTFWIAGLVALTHGRLKVAAELFEAALAGGREANDTVVMHALIGSAFVATSRGEFSAARAALSQSLAEAQGAMAEVQGAVAVSLLQPMVKWILGTIELATGDATLARDSLGEVVNIARSSVISRYAALPLVLRAEAHLALGELDQAAASLDEAVLLARSGSLTWVLGRAAAVQAKLRACNGERQEAESLAHEAISFGIEAGDQLGVVDALELLARLAAEQDSKKEAIRLWAAAEAQRDRLGYRFSTDHAASDAALAQARQWLGPDDFAAAWAEGAKLSIDEAVVYSARGRGERKRPTAGWASLTPSEREVVRLVGQHLSNPEIAARLFVSRATIKTHLVHIFGKLGIASRSELAAEAVKRRG